MKFTTIVLAADREHENPVARAADAPCKAMVPLAGKPMLERILKALAQCREIARILICGPGESIWKNITIDKPAGKPIDWVPPDASPSRSAWRCMEQIDDHQPIVLTAADIAFPQPRVFDDFCRRAAESGADVAVGLVPYTKVAARFPGVRRTPLKFSDGPFCTCNLFAFLTPRGRELVRLWKKLEQDRKRPWRLIRALGLMPLLLYLTGRLTTAEAARRVERKLGIKAAFIALPYPEAAIDVDTEQDLTFVRRLLNHPD